MVVPYLRKWKAWPLYYVLDSCYHMDLCWFVVRLWVCYYYIWVNTGFNSIRVKKKKTWIWWLYIDFKQARSMFVARGPAKCSASEFQMISHSFSRLNSDFLSSFQFNDCSQVLTLWITVCMRQLGHKEDQLDCRWAMTCCAKGQHEAVEVSWSTSIFPGPQTRDWKRSTPCSKLEVSKPTKGTALFHAAEGWGCVFC